MESRDQILPGPSLAQLLYQKALGSRLNPILNRPIKRYQLVIVYRLQKAIFHLLSSNLLAATQGIEFTAKKRNLSSKKASDIGFQQQSRIYLNGSLTQKGRMLLKKVKEFKINHHYKFLWTRQGKVFLKTNESQSQIASFTSMDESEAFEAE